MTRKVRLDLTRSEALALVRLTQRGWDEIEEGDYDGAERWSGRAECLRVLTRVREAAFGPGWAARAVSVSDPTRPPLVHRRMLSRGSAKTPPAPAGGNTKGTP